MSLQGIRRFFSTTNVNNAVKARRYIFEKQFEGMPKATDLRLVEEELPPLKDGEFLSEAIYLSVDPYQRAYHKKLGTTMIGSQVAKVLESKNFNFPEGSYVVGEFGWRTHTISNGVPLPNGFPAAWIIPDPEGLPLSLSLGVLGMPGNTAYFGLLELCQPKEGEVVAVSGAAGAVGSLVGQIAKIKGCRVVGIAGSDQKGKWLIDELNFDNFVNYKDPEFKRKLREVTPKGVDYYFDNVGGQISTLVANRMNLFGKIAVCGAIAGYNDLSAARADAIQPAVALKQLKMEGFIVSRWLNRWFEGIAQNRQWVKEGKLKYRETVYDGFDNMLNAFVDMLQGGNVGKAIVKV